MIALAITTIALAFMTAASEQRDINVSLEPAMIVDLFAWYIIGAWLGVLPTLV